ncbi:transcriptional regulator/sugar kinase [Sanguibacter keddieii DSM 10542]|uniref:Transcriptional regulator/sugar kinase n=1 Tax=Sanguibacter keddieii (strain ATCC 51767 / DSM 10542 / NCFB 3025 / ST-74) TaxID=446469 RepID=D1BD50_SANKS|nr:ROK family transcriptional regulator [Sanguibacter keddieii]ACZ23054.1 transcriptional regulator/sugar kinase [Sanguibacter keddieii DSM 10542]
MSEAGHGGSPVTDSARDLAREVLVHGPISRTELSRRLGLSPASLTRLSRTFLDSGILVEGPEVSDGAVGRPVKPLDVRVDARRFVGIKLTGEAALGVSTDLRADQTGSASSDLASTTLDGVLDAIERVVGALGGPAGFDGIGVSLGGNVSDGVVDRAPFLGWRDVDLRSALVDRLGIPTTVENDVVALTAAEHWFGAGRGSTDFAVLTIGAGVGYGLVVNDHVVRTADVGFGLLGHFPLDPTGPLCMDGHRGCSTAMLTTGSMCAQVSVALARQVTYDEVLLLAAQDHPVAREVVGSAVRSLGRLIAAITNIALVSTVVLAGEGVGLVEGRAAELEAAIAADRDPDGGPVRLVVDDSGFVPWARGAAAVAIQSSFGVLGT